MDPTGATLHDVGSDAGRVRRWSERACFALVAAVLCFLLDGFLLALVPDAGRLAGPLERQLDEGWWIWYTIWALTGAPLFETALMAGLLHWLARLVPPTAAVLLCALVCTACHRIDGGTNWLVFPSFVVLSCVYLVRRKSPHDDGFTTTALAHALTNAMSLATMMVLVVLSR